jgi:guanylate kinase
MAPSGSGKKSLVDSVLANHRDIYFAKTFTTRAIRPGVEENPLYSFISREVFEEMIAENELVEWAEYSGNYYGTPKSELIEPLKQGKVVFKEMELQGVLQIRDLIPADRHTVVYVDGGPWESLQNRIVNRAPISEEELEGRRLRYEQECTYATEADVIIRNHDGELDQAIAQMEQVVTDLLAKVQTT